MRAKFRETTFSQACKIAKLISRKNRSVKTVHSEESFLTFESRIPHCKKTLKCHFCLPQVVGYKGRAVVVVSCVTSDAPYKPHPHNLVGKEGCSKGVCTIEMDSDSMSCSFPSLGIQCVKKKEIEESLSLRQQIRVDPFQSKQNLTDRSS